MANKFINNKTASKFINNKTANKFINNKTAHKFINDKTASKFINNKTAGKFINNKTETNLSTTKQKQIYQQQNQQANLSTKKNIKQIYQQQNSKQIYQQQNSKQIYQQQNSKQIYQQQNGTQIYQQQNSKQIYQQQNSKQSYRQQYSEHIYMSHDMRFLTIWYMRPAKSQISLRIPSVWSEPLLVYWIFYESWATDWTLFGVSKLIRRLHRLVWVYICQNTTLLKITSPGSIILSNLIWLYDASFTCARYLYNKNSHTSRYFLLSPFKHFGHHILPFVDQNSLHRFFGKGPKWNPWVKIFQDYSWIQDLEADFPQKVSLNMLN